MKIESGRQRNLQYHVSFHDLEEDKRTVDLTSGDFPRSQIIECEPVFHHSFFLSFQGLMPPADFVFIWNAKGTNLFSRSSDVHQIHYCVLIFLFGTHVFLFLIRTVL